MSPAEVADRFFAAIEAGDAAALETLYDADAVIWHNAGAGEEQSVAQNLRVLRWLSRNLTGLRYTAIRRHVHAAGFVQQHVVRGALPDRREVAIPAALFAAVRDGRITRIDEYTDSAASAPLHELAARPR